MSGLEYAREGEGQKSDLDFLLTFLEKEIQHQERSFIFKEPLHLVELAKITIQDYRYTECIRRLVKFQPI